MPWSSQSTSIFGMSPKSSLIMEVKPKSFSSQHSKRWVSTENSLRNRRSPSMVLVGKELNQSGSSPNQCRSAPPKNPHMEYITFDVVDILYPYNAIFWRGFLNTFEVVLHLGYLCLKIPATFGVILVFGSQQDVRNIEKGFTPGHINKHFL
jgi:hypothetical protein